MLDELIHMAATKGVSDIILREGQPMWVRLHGVVSRTSEPKTDGKSRTITSSDIVELMRTIEADTGVKHNELSSVLAGRTGDADFAATIKGIRFRGNVYHTNNRQLSIALRRLSDTAPSLETLGLPRAYFDKLLTQSRGLILVTGGTGSGKTTTLASTIGYLNQNRSGHIITLEDPVEYLHKSVKCLVDQRQIGRDAPSFAAGLRASLREDPDIIFIGELRDLETIKTALSAAQTGHLVLASMHTNNAQQSVERLTSEFGPEGRALAQVVLSQALLGCLSQVLVPRANGQGQVLATELMICTPDVKSAIRDGKSAGIFNAMDTGSQQGHVMLNRELARLVREQVISREDAIYAAYDVLRLESEMKGIR